MRESDDDTESSYVRHHHPRQGRGCISLFQIFSLQNHQVDPWAASASASERKQQPPSTISTFYPLVAVIDLVVLPVRYQYR